MVMEHFLCDDVGGKRNVCGMALHQYLFIKHFLHTTEHRT